MQRQSLAGFILVLFSYLFSIPGFMQFIKDVSNGINQPCIEFIPESLFVFGVVGSQRTRLRGMKPFCILCGITCFLLGWKSTYAVKFIYLAVMYFMLFNNLVVNAPEAYGGMSKIE
jgi:hypothetical protein